MLIMPAKRKRTQGKTQKSKGNAKKVNNVKENKTFVKMEIKEEPGGGIETFYTEMNSSLIPLPRGRIKRATKAKSPPPKKGKSNTLKYDAVVIKCNNMEMISIPEFPDIKLKIRGGKHPYLCAKCDLGFWTKNAYDAHTPLHILKKSKQPVKKFRCDVCAKEFSKLCDVERHTRVHTGEKPSICNICNKRFQQSHNLSKHLLTHLHIKPFHCEICNKQFGRQDVLRRHLLTHSVDKPFKCSVCVRGFIRQTQLLQHMRRKHPNQPTDHLIEQYGDDNDGDSSDNREDIGDQHKTKTALDMNQSSSSSTFKTKA